MSITGDTFGLDEAIIHEKVNDRFKGKSVNRLISFISEHKILGVDSLFSLLIVKLFTMTVLVQINLELELEV